MKKKLFFFLCALLIIASAGCIDSVPSNIPANVSVNTAWGGDMCEANGYIYYVSGDYSNQKIVRMERDGSNPAPVTAGEYYYIKQLTSDGDCLYFAASMETGHTDTIYRLPLSGGKEQKVADGNVFALQSANGRLYWENIDGPSGLVTSDQTASIQIKCVNPDGSGLQTLYTLEKSALDPVHFELLIAGESIYYATDASYIDDAGMPCDIYRMDLNGKNTVKLNNSKLDMVDKLFYDQGKLYFLMEHFNNHPSFMDLGLWDSLETLDDKGETETIIDAVGYFPQDFGCIEYCGISNDIFYYFVITSCDDNSGHIFMDLRKFDLKTKKDTVILHHTEMGDPATCTLFSVRGKSIEVERAAGLYILGNDIYYSPSSLP